jgi:hypothetical protein
VAARKRTLIRIWEGTGIPSVTTVSVKQTVVPFPSSFNSPHIFPALRSRVSAACLIHGYATIADEVVWCVFETNFPVLTREVMSLLKKLATGYNRVIVCESFFKNGWSPDFFKIFFRSRNFCRNFFFENICELFFS